MLASVDLEMTVFALCIKVIEIALFMYFVECHSDSPGNPGFASLLCRGYKMSNK